MRCHMYELRQKKIKELQQKPWFNYALLAIAIFLFSQGNEIIKKSDGRLEYIKYFEKDVKEYIDILKSILAKKGYTVQQITKSWFARFKKYVFPTNYGDYGFRISCGLIHDKYYCGPDESTLQEYFGIRCLRWHMIKPEFIESTTPTFLEYLALLCCPIIISISHMPFKRVPIGN